jgi:hypothetical protein
MNVDRFSITMDPELGRAVRDAADHSGMSVSAWLTGAAADLLRNQLLGVALDAWETDSKPFSDQELADAARILGVHRVGRGGDS